jgi:type II secretion system protein H
MRLTAVHSPRGFTLIELIVVMTLLATIFAMVAPRLSGFVSGRSVAEESRRLLASTQYARSRAIDRAERTEVWIDLENRQYGVRPASPTDSQSDIETERPVTFQLADKLTLEVDEQFEDEEGIVRILFWPDGSVDEESPVRMTLNEENVPRKAIALSDNRLQFVIEEAAADAIR